MDKPIPSVAEVRTKLLKLGHAQIQALAALSGVPFQTIWNLRSNVTKNPGLDTTGKFWPFIERVAAKAESKAGA